MDPSTDDMQPPHNAEGHFPDLGESLVGLPVTDCRGADIRPSASSPCPALLARSDPTRTAAPDSEWLTAAPSGRVFVRTFKYQRRSRRAYSEHGSHSLARRTPSGVSDDKPASWNARPALTRSQRPALLVMLSSDVAPSTNNSPRRLTAQGDSSRMLAIIGWLSRIVAARLSGRGDRSASWPIRRHQRKRKKY